MSSSSNTLDVFVGPHQPEKLLPVTRPFTAIKAKLQAHLQEELPNLRTSAWHTWTQRTAMGTDKAQKEPRACECLLKTIPYSRASHWDVPAQRALSATSALHRVQRWERHFIRGMMVLYQQKHQIRPRKTSLRFGAQSAEFLILTSIHHWFRSMCFLIQIKKWTNTPDIFSRKKLTQRTGPDFFFFLAQYIKVIYN